MANIKVNGIDIETEWGDEKSSLGADGLLLIGALDALCIAYDRLNDLSYSNAYTGECATLMGTLYSEIQGRIKSSHKEY